MNENFGASFSIDITALKAGLAQANRLIRESESEFRAAAAGMDDWRESQDGLQSRIKYLNSAIDVQRKKVDALTEDYKDQISKGLDPASKAAVEMRTAINKEQAALAKNEKELREQTEALREMEKGSDKASEKVKEVGEAAKDTGDGFTVAKGAIAGFISDGLSAIVGSAKNAISSLMGLAESTREYREDLVKLKTAYETAGFSTEQATKAYKELYSVIGEEDRSVEAVNHLAKLVDTEEELAKWTGTILPGVWATFGDSLPLEGLTEAANETAKVGKLTGVLADALNWAGKSEEAFQASLDKCTTEQERQKLITETLNSIYGDAAEAYKENNASIIESRNATSDYTDSMAELGEAIEPITTTAQKGFTRLADAAVKLVKKVDFKKFEKAIDDAFDSLIDDILPAVIDGFEWIIDNRKTIGAALAGIFAYFTAAKIINGVVNLTDKIKALFALMSTNPWGLAATAVALLAGGIATLIVANQEEASATRKAIDANEEFIDSMEEREQAYYDTKAAAEEAAAAELSELTHVERLNEELGGLVDAQGKVKKQDEERVAFILNELNEAFGTEYQLIDGVIQGYKNLQAEIDNTIAKKKASIMLEPLEAAYTEAVQNQAQTERDVGTARAELAEQTELVNSKQEELNGLYDEYHRLMRDGGTQLEINEIFEEIQAREKALDEEKELLASRKEAYEQATSELQGYYAAIEKYETAQSLMVSGKTQEAIEYMTGLNSVAAESNRITDEQSIEYAKKLEEDARVTREYADQMREWYKEGVEGVSEEMVKSAEEAAKAAEDAFETQGRAIIDALNNGVVQNSWKIGNTINRMVREALNEATTGIPPSGTSSSYGLLNNPPKMATGGIVNRATHAIIGEAGAEGVFPLERNLEWLDIIAEKLSTRMGGGGRSVVVNQTNNYSQAHSQYEIFKSQEATAKIVSRALKGV